MRRGVGCGVRIQSWHSRARPRSYGLVSRTRTIGFMVPMHEHKRKGAFREAQGAASTLPAEESEKDPPTRRWQHLGGPVLLVRQVLDRVAFWRFGMKAGRKRQRTGAVQDATARSADSWCNACEKRKGIHPVLVRWGNLTLARNGNRLVLAVWIELNSGENQTGIGVFPSDHWRRKAGGFFEKDATY